MRYDTARWHKKRRHILALDGYKDRVAAWYGKAVEATIVHHIYPADEYPQWRYCDWNLISVSFTTHNKLENRQTGELTELGLWLQSIIKPGEDWRKKNGKI